MNHFSGKDYNYFRDYDPSVGRYVESDLIGLAAGLNTYAYVGSNPLSWFDSLGLDVEVGVRQFYPVPFRYVRHCFVRFNGDNNDTLSFDNKGVHPDPNPSGTSWLNRGSSQFSSTSGTQNDSCVKKEMNTCNAKDYDPADYNCCTCVANALNACGLRNNGEWPNWPKQPNNPPYSPPIKK